MEMKSISTRGCGPEMENQFSSFSPLSQVLSSLGSAAGEKQRGIEY